ncbi:MAG: hypothetical protein VKJ04_10165 [Vampirovibrionales bacterium]|nr:hypothetical protein [Vampirovibrionales bacterium]
MPRLNFFSLTHIAKHTARGGRLFFCLVIMAFTIIAFTPLSPAFGKKHPSDPSSISAPFEFIVIGDMPYHLPEDYQRLTTLITAINQEKPAFTVHVGDIMSGATPCTDGYYFKVRDLFNTFDQPLIYTPGDNEWTDCHRIYRLPPQNPIKQLARVRSIFYPPQAGFERDLPVLRQSAQAAYGDYVENVRWQQKGFIFTTLHIVGSNNRAPGADGENEFEARRNANHAWLLEAFEHALLPSVKGLVIFMQANPNFEFSEKSKAREGFNDFIDTLQLQVPRLGKPVLLIHGDSHRFWLDKPLMSKLDNSQVLKNFTRVCVFGDTQRHGVRFIQNNKNPDLLDIRPFWGE